MNLKTLYRNNKVPANSSRSFHTHGDSVSQPQGDIELVFSSKEGFVKNVKFNSELIRYDDSYNTLDHFQLEESLKYLEPLIKKLTPDLVVEIGCGQGELVKKLVAKGIKSIGFDTVLVEPNSFLFKKDFNPNQIQNYKSSKILFVLRCVLPHIPDPFIFVNDLIGAFPNAQVLIEYQDLNYLIRNKLWLNISHDHVNYFDHKSFRRKYHLADNGFFASAEWGFVVINGRKRISKPIFLRKFVLVLQFVKLNEFKRNQLLKLAQYKYLNIMIYGAGGKSTQLCHELKLMGFRNLCLIDQNRHKENRFLESSGYKIVSVKTAQENAEDSSIILVVNSRHFEYVSLKFPLAQVERLSDI